MLIKDTACCCLTELNSTSIKQLIQCEVKYLNISVILVA